jgi:hypothetical protein
MAENSSHGGKRKHAGRKSSATKLLEAGFVAPWLTQELQEIKWTSFINHDDPKIALDALKYLSNRIYGMPKQAVENTGKDGGPIQHAITVKFVDSTSGS